MSLTLMPHTIAVIRLSFASHGLYRFNTEVRNLPGSSPSAATAANISYVF
jgi:hypothetical protein